MTTQAGWITRDALSLTDLTICDSTYVLDENGPGDLAVTWRRQLATSAYVHDAIEVAAVKDTSTMPLTFTVTGASIDAATDAVATLLEAVTQRTWELHLTVDSTEYAWSCRRADYNVGLAARDVLNFALPVRLSVPRSPIPLAGPA